MNSKKTSAAAIVGLVLAVIGLLLSAVPIVNNFAFVLAVIGLVLGIIALVGIKKGKASGKKIALITIVLATLAVIIVLVSQATYGAVIDGASKKINETTDRATGKKTEDLLKDDVDVALGKFTVTQGEFGTTNTELPVTVTNKRSEAKSYSIQIEALDAAGNRITDDYVYANDLGANQKQEFKLFRYVETDQVEKMKSATFRIVGVSQT